MYPKNTMETVILYVFITFAYATFLLQTDLRKKAAMLLQNQGIESGKFVTLAVFLVSFLWPYLLLRRVWRKLFRKSEVLEA